MYIQYSIKSWIENFLRIILYIYIDLIIVTTILFILLYLRYGELLTNNQFQHKYKCLKF